MAASWTDSEPGFFALRHELRRLMERASRRRRKVLLAAAATSALGVILAVRAPHDYNAQLIGLEARQHTGWLVSDGSRGTYAPHTVSKFKAPANKTLLLLGNGFLARRNLAKARKAGRVAALRG